MPVTLKNRNGTLTAFIKGEIDHHTVPDIRDAIDDAFVSIENINVLVLDFYDVTFMDSSGVGLVMGRYRLASNYGKKIRVDNLSDRDFKIMQMSGIPKLAEIKKRNEELLWKKLMNLNWYLTVNQ